MSREAFQQNYKPQICKNSNSNCKHNVTQARVFHRREKCSAGHYNVATTTF